MTDTIRSVVCLAVGLAVPAQAVAQEQWRHPRFLPQRFGSPGGACAAGVFTDSTPRDSPAEVAASINGLIGADLQRRLRLGLREGGWDFCEAWPEDHGWHSEVAVSDEGKTLGADLVTCPELDEANAEGGALNGRWPVVIGMNLGMWPKTRTRRTVLLKRLATDVERVCCDLGAADFVWEVGGTGSAWA